MKKVIGQVTERFPTVLNEVDIDSARDLQEKYGHEIPVLFINGRKAFKYRVTARELARRIHRSRKSRDTG